MFFAISLVSFAMRVDERTTGDSQLVTVTGVDTNRIVKIAFVIVEIERYSLPRLDNAFAA